MCLICGSVVGKALTLVTHLSLTVHVACLLLLFHCLSQVAFLLFYICYFIMCIT